MRKRILVRPFMEQFLRFARSISRRRIGTKNMLEDDRHRHFERAKLPEGDRVGIDTDAMAELFATPSKADARAAKLGSGNGLSIHLTNLEHGLRQCKAQRE